MRSGLLIASLIASANAFPVFSSWFNLEAEKPRLIKLAPDNYQIVSGDSEKFKLRRENINFIDVTNQISIEEAYANGLVSKSSTSFFDKVALLGAKQVKTLEKEIPVYNYPTEVKYPKAVKKILKAIDKNIMLENLTKFTSFYNRYFKSETGFESAKWLYGHIEEIVEPVKDIIKLRKFKHEEWDQFSIIVSIPGKVEDKVILGAHQDSTNLLFPNLMKAPGADDDGSGTVTILEALRLLVCEMEKGKFNPYNTLEFHFYSAEEGGLLGSIDVFSSYFAEGETVVGMLQQDMTGYTGNLAPNGVEPHLGLVADYTSINLNNFIKVIISEYNSIPYHETECGYACSDHASALENGYPSSFIIETEFKYTSKFIHSVMDTVDRIDWDHVEEHVRLSVAFAYELSFADTLH